jgi:hypothetical protein
MNDKLKSKLKELKALLFSEEAPAAKPEEAPVEFTEVKGKDGKAYKVSAMEIGASIEVIDEAGVSAPAPDGEVEIEDGSTLVIAEGKISEIKPKEDKPAEEKPTEEPAAQFNAEDFVAKTAFDALQTSFNDLSNKFEAIVKANEGLSTTIKAMFEVVDAISNESEEKPSGAPVHSAFKAAKTEKEIAQENLKKAIQAATKK